MSYWNGYSYQIVLLHEMKRRLFSWELCVERIKWAHIFCTIVIGWFVLRVENNHFASESYKQYVMLIKSCRIAKVYCVFNSNTVQSTQLSLDIIIYSSTCLAMPWTLFVWQARWNDSHPYDEEGRGGDKFKTTTCSWYTHYYQ